VNASIAGLVETNNASMPDLTSSSSPRRLWDCPQGFVGKDQCDSSQHNSQCCGYSVPGENCGDRADDCFCYQWNCGQNEEPAELNSEFAEKLNSELQQCVPSNGECGGPGRRTETCCGNAKCTNLMGGGVMKCVEEQPKCVPGNGECGGPGRRTETCCGTAKCTSLMGGGVMKCVEEQPKCVPGNGECGGPGRRTETCCGNAKCTSLMGGGVMKCL